MKWFLLSLALVAGIAIASASCGPTRAFCPSSSDNTCFTNPDAMTGPDGQDQGMCDGGSVIVCLDPAQTKVCKQSDCPQ
jgi:hypothetical protein